MEASQADGLNASFESCGKILRVSSTIARLHGGNLVVTMVVMGSVRHPTPQTLKPEPETLNPVQLKAKP